MPKTYPNLPFPTLKRLKQETLSYCGPAVIQMLLDFQCVEVTQDQIVDAAQARHKVETHGVFIPEMAAAVRTLAPELQFWYKHQASMSDLSVLVNMFGHPVGVEWQGVFIYEDEEEEEDDDPGHYSIVTAIDTRQNTLLLADPFRDFAGQDRHFTVREYEERWWETNEVIDPLTHKAQEIYDYHTLFLITHKEALFPEHISMIRG